MTATVWDQMPHTDIDRQKGSGRPYVYPSPGATEKVTYTRCTTYIDAIEDKFKLNEWTQRLMAIGLATRDDYLLEVKTAMRDNESKEGKERLNEICEKAAEYAKASSKATVGTYLHAMTELVDLGQPVDNVPPEYLLDLAAYAAAVEPLKMVHIEKDVVLDKLKIHGTPDRVVEYKGKRYIADVKTGGIEWGATKIAAQLAVYARAALYDRDTGERTPHGADTHRGLIIHLPAGTGTCELVWVNLEVGWTGVKLCEAVRSHRQARVTRVGLDAPPFDAAPVADIEPVDNLLTVIAHAEDAQSLRILWRSNPHLFQPHHIEAAKIRITELETESVKNQ